MRRSVSRAGRGSPGDGRADRLDRPADRTGDGRAQVGQVAGELAAQHLGPLEPQHAEAHQRVAGVAERVRNVVHEAQCTESTGRARAVAAARGDSGKRNPPG